MKCILFDFIEWGFCRNVWVWAHGLGGLFAGLIGVSIGLDPWLVFCLTMIGAILWEIWQWWKCKWKVDLRFFYDSLGDIILAGINCLAIVWIAWRVTV